MALSNIGREPRREITESAIGVIALAGWATAAFFIARTIDPPHVMDKYEVAWGLQIAFFMLVVGVAGPLIVFILLHLTHALGETVCGWMKAARIDPRPRQRY